MKKRSKNKVMIITTIAIIFVGCALAIYHIYRKQVDVNSDQQYIAFQNIELPNGSTSTLLLTTEQHNIQGWIGANLSDLTQDIKKHLSYTDHDGVYVQDTLRDSPAQTAGILPGDIITRINATETQEVLQTIRLITTLNPGDTYPFTVFRQGQYLEYLVTITHKQHFS